MAYPALIQKIFDLRRALGEEEEENRRLCAALAELAQENIEMSSRITRLELGLRGELCLHQPGNMDPAGYYLPCGARVAPITVVEKSHNPHQGAALTVVVDNLN